MLELDIEEPDVEDPSDVCSISLEVQWIICDPKMLDICIQNVQACMNFCSYSCLLNF
jgi:hypothetical protein